LADNQYKQNRIDNFVSRVLFHNRSFPNGKVPDIKFSIQTFVNILSGDREFANIE
jgi:hypothetical protein